MDVPSQHCSSRQELIDFLCGSAGGTRRRGRPTCPTRQPCLPASSEAGECGQTGQRIGQEPARRRLPIAFCKATCAAPADALDIGGSAGYCLIWPGLCGDPAGPCCRTPTWCGHEICFFSALGQQGRCKGSRPATRSRPRWEAAARSCWQWFGHLPARHRGTKRPRWHPRHQLAPPPPRRRWGPNQSLLRSRGGGSGGVRRHSVAAAQLRRSRPRGSRHARRAVTEAPQPSTLCRGQELPALFPSHAAGWVTSP